MPIDPTPFEQEVVAEATKLTVEPTVLPLVGVVIVTPANAEIDAKIKARHKGEHRFMSKSLLRIKIEDRVKTTENKGNHTDEGRDP
jgi:hypothetical protein